jgi:plastocyanin
MRRSLPVKILALALPAAPALADGGGAEVPIYNASYAVPHVDVLAGDTVTWTNDSVRAHTVMADDGSWTSPRLIASASFGRTFDAPGDFAYYCQLHPSMRGDVGVHRVLLDAPRDAAAAGRPYVLTGRAAVAAGSEVTIETGGAVAATAQVDEHGAFSATVKPPTTTTYTAVAAGEPSPAVSVLVLDRKVSASARFSRTRVTVAARVTPASRGATVVLQLKLKEHFGWWPVRTARLGADSRVKFSLPRGRRVAARVLLTASDGATELARSATFRLRLAA